MTIKSLPTLTYSWQYHERHDVTVRQVLKDDGCMDRLNRLRSWHGNRTQDKLEASGHNKLDFHSCSCHPTEMLKQSLT